MTALTKSSDTAAIWISRIFHPLIIVIPTMILAVCSTNSGLLSAISWTAAAIGIVNIPMAIFLVTGVRSGRYSDMSVSIKEQRHSIYLIGGGSLVILVIVLILGNAPQVLIACLVAAIATSVIGYMINLRTKISLHSAAIAGCTTVLLITYLPTGIFLLAAMPLVAWSRIRLKHHTPSQILLGWLVPAASVVVVFSLMGLT